MVRLRIPKREASRGVSADKAKKGGELGGRRCLLEFLLRSGRNDILQERESDIMGRSLNARL
jgi:hypothetical protein